MSCRLGRRFHDCFSALLREGLISWEASLPGSSLKVKAQEISPKLQWPSSVKSSFNGRAEQQRIEGVCMIASFKHKTFQMLQHPPAQTLKIAILCMCVCVYVCVCVCVCVYVCVCGYVCVLVCAWFVCVFKKCFV